jgi:hypothetical protein
MDKTSAVGSEHTANVNFRIIAFRVIRTHLGMAHMRRWTVVQLSAWILGSKRMTHAGDIGSLVTSGQRCTLINGGVPGSLDLLL